MIKKFQSLPAFQPINWEDLPDYGLYSDQLISFIESKLQQYYDDKLLTASMINNYVKLQMMPKPINRKYYREHIAHLIIISLLKSLLPIARIKEGIELQLRFMGIEAAYNEFMHILNKSMHDILVSLQGENDNNIVYQGFVANRRNISITVAVQAFCFQAITRNIINMKGVYNEHEPNQ